MKYKYDNLTLTASVYNRKLALELPMDSNADEVFDAFKALMVGMTFSEKTFNDAVVRYFYEQELNNDE